MLWRADEAIRPKRESFRVMRISKRRGSALIRHSGLRAVGDHPFIHRSPQEIEDLIGQGLLRRTIPKKPAGQWQVDLTDEGRTRAEALHSSASVVADKPGAQRFLELIDDRIAEAAALGVSVCRSRSSPASGHTGNRTRDSACDYAPADASRPRGGPARASQASGPICAKSSSISSHTWMS
jgi:hypothetical protein